MPRKFAPLLLACAASLVAADSALQSPATQKVEESHTEKLTLPAGGVLHLQHSYGEAGIEGWDGPDVEITTIKSTRDFYSAADKAKGTAELDKVHITSKVSGKEVLVTTAYPRHSFPPGMPWAEAPIDLEYRIKVPMNAPIVVEHGAGEVHFDNVAGDIHAYVRNGTITLDLAPDSRYGIQAGAKWGGVISDFPGKPHRRFWLIGHQFTGTSADGAHQLVLKAGYGDIIIFKQWKPEATR
jgi:hypothetical protein